MSLRQSLESLRDAFPRTDETQPALFVGHGNPMNAIEDNAYSAAWERLGEDLPTPKAILCVSAHWETRGTKLTAMERPETIHDFGAFPPELFAVQYPAPGSPELARLTQASLTKTSAELAHDWGLDHGTWSVLARMFPAATIPVVQLSLDRTEAPEFHYALGEELRELRQRGVLVIGSGNIVHNLRLARFDSGPAADWATEFDATVKAQILSGDHAPLINYERLGESARLAIPTNEHYLPLLYVLGLQNHGESISFFSERIDLRSISMTSVRVG